MHDDTYIIVPVFNEATVVAETVAGLLTHFTHVVCVDDGSTDGTDAVLELIPCTTIRHPLNLGQGAALQTGIEFALKDPAARSFVTFDADGQHRVEDAEALLAELESSCADVVLGSRFLADGSGPRGLRRLLLRVGTAITNASTGLKLTDTHNGLRAFNRKFAEDLRFESHDMGHASEFIIHAARGGYSVRETPTTVLYTEYSLAKGQPLSNGINIALDLVLSVFHRGGRR